MGRFTWAVLELFTTWQWWSSHWSAGLLLLYKCCSHFKCCRHPKNASLAIHCPAWVIMTTLVLAWTPVRLQNHQDRHAEVKQSFTRSQPEVAKVLFEASWLSIVPGNDVTNLVGNWKIYWSLELSSASESRSMILPFSRRFQSRVLSASWVPRWAPCSDFLGRRPDSPNTWCTLFSSACTLGRPPWKLAGHFILSWRNYLIDRQLGY